MHAHTNTFATIESAWQLHSFFHSSEKHRLIDTREKSSCDGKRIFASKIQFLGFDTKFTVSFFNWISLGFIKFPTKKLFESAWTATLLSILIFIFFIVYIEESLQKSSLVFFTDRQLNSKWKFYVPWQFSLYTSIVAIANEEIDFHKIFMIEIYF